MQKRKGNDVPNEPRSRSGWKKATWDDLSKALRLEWADSQGYVTCVTCGSKNRWNSGEVHAGHYLAGRYESILFLEAGIHPQCRGCNTAGHINYGYGGLRKKETVSQAFDRYMRETVGTAVVEALQFLRGQERQHTIDELRVMRTAYKLRQQYARREKGL